MSYARKKRSTWYVCFKNEQGRNVQQASSAKTKAEALRLAQARETFEEQVRHGVATRESALTVGQLFQKWSASKAALSSHETDAMRWRKHLAPTLEHLPMRQLTGAVLEELLLSKLKKKNEVINRNGLGAGKGRGKNSPLKLGPQSLSHLRRLVSRMFNWAAKKDLWAGKNPAARVELPQIIEKIPTTASPEHVHQLLAEAVEPYRTAFAIALYAGLRSAEILGLEVSRVNLTAGVLLIEKSLNRESTKSGRYRVLPIVPELRPYLEAHLSTVKTGHLFNLSAYKWPKNHLLNQLQQTMRRAGIPPGLTVHALRHTYLTQLSMSGADPRAVQALAGHSDLKTTQRYVHLRDSYLVTQAGKLSYEAPAEVPAPSDPALTRPDEHRKNIN